MFGLLPIDAPNFSESIGVFSDHLIGLKGCSWQKEVEKRSFWSTFWTEMGPPCPGSLRFGQWHTKNFVLKKLEFVKSRRGDVLRSSGCF